MCALSAGQTPAGKVRAGFARAAAAALLAALGGCASNSYSTAAYHRATDARVAQAVTEVEDDGLPAQSPPPARIRRMADDPSEPFSRNYGGANPSALGVAPREDEPEPKRAPRPQLPNDLPPAFRAKLAAALAADE